MDEQISQGLNLEESNKISEKPLYKQYREWLKNNGVIIDSSVMYPAYFGNAKAGVVGVAANKAIPSSHAIIAVPYDLIITVDKVKEDKTLLKIITDNPNIFNHNEDAAFFILTLFMTKQLIKEKQSFYAPYFAIAEKNSLGDWTHFDILALENPQLARLMKDQTEQIEEHFMTFLSIFRRYPNVFPQELSNTQYKKIFETSYNFICTRAFGWSLPSISLIPMADSLNHNNDYVTHMLIDTKLQQSPHQNYKIKHKKFNLSLLSQMHPQMPKSQPAPRKKHRSEKFVEKHKQILSGTNKKDSQAYILWQQYKAGVRNFRQLHFYDESCQEDNDTDDETIQKLEFDLQKFRFYEKYQTNGINEKNKVNQLIKYWKIFLDPAFEDQQEQQQQTVKPASQKNVQQIKQKFANESKQSQGSSLVSSSSSSDSDDQQFKWMASNPQSHNHKTTYFIMSTRTPIKKNSQIYNFYGRRSNKFLLVGYNFALNENKYDSFSFRINIENWRQNKKALETRLPLSKLINRDGKVNMFFTKEIRLKRQKVCIELVNHSRALLIGWGEFKGGDAKVKVRVTIPFSLEFEKKVLGLAVQFIKYFQKEFMTTLEEDEQLLEKAQKHEAKTAIRIRMNYKQILQHQLQLLQTCIKCLKDWKTGKINVNNQQEMREYGKIRHYLCSLERAKI